MSHLQEEIKDEEKDHEHYERLAKKDPRNRAAFRRMAADEDRHQDKLKAIEVKEYKTKALKKRIK
jgi:rubrerythrin